MQTIPKKVVELLRPIPHNSACVPHIRGSGDAGGDETLDRRTFACGGAGLLGFVVFILLVAEQDSRYVEDKSDQIQVVRADVRSVIDLMLGPSVWELST